MCAEMTQQMCVSCRVKHNIQNKKEGQRVFEVRQHDVLKVIRRHLTLLLVDDAKSHTWKAIRRGRTMQAAMRGVTLEGIQDVGQWSSSKSYLNYTNPDQLDAALAQRELQSVRKRQKCEAEKRQSEWSPPSSPDESSSDSDGS